MADINVSGLVQYTNQLAMPLLRESILGGRTIGLIKTQTGIKFADAINIQTSTLTPVLGGAGAWVAAGSTTAYTQRPLQVTEMKATDSLSMQNLELFWPGMSAKGGSYNETMPNEVMEAYNADKVARVQKANEFAAWQSSSTGTFSLGNTYSNGFLHLAYFDSGISSTINVCAATYSGALTPANAIPIVDTMVSTIYSSIEDILERDDIAVFMSLSAFRVYVNAWIYANNYHVNAQDQIDIKNFTFTIPTTGIKIIGTLGLKGRNEIFLSPLSNMYFGTDLQSDEDGYELWFEKKDDALLWRIKYKIGFQLVYGKYCAIYKG